MIKISTGAFLMICGLAAFGLGHDGWGFWLCFFGLLDLLFSD